MMARSLKGSINRPDTEAQDQPSPNHHFRLATRGRSIQMGQHQILPFPGNPNTATITPAEILANEGDRHVANHAIRQER